MTKPAANKTCSIDTEEVVEGMLCFRDASLFLHAHWALGQCTMLFVLRMEVEMTTLSNAGELNEGAAAGGCTLAAIIASPIFFFSCFTGEAYY